MNASQEAAVPTTKITIRDAKPSDAAAVNAYVKAIFAEARHLITRPTEFRMGRWRQRLWIARKLDNPYERCLIALHDGKIVGMLDNWTDSRRRIRHVTTFAMSVRADWRGRGVGKKLLLHFIDWVQKHDVIDRVELHVHSDNDAAMHLYRSLGFELEGTRKGAVRYEDGRTVDDHIMALWPKEAARP